MSNRFINKNIILLLLLFIIILSGVILFVKLIRNKRAFEENIYSYIPVEVSSILRINNEKSINRLIRPEERLHPVIQTINSSLNLPILYIYYKSDAYIMSKVGDGEEDVIKEKLQDSLFPYHYVKRIKYKENILFLYASQEGDFFACTFYNGFFIGGYSIKLLCDILDTDVTSNRVIANSPLTKEMPSYMKGNYPANIFLNNYDCFSVFNIDFNSTKIELEGYDTRIVNNNSICGDETKITSLDNTLFPDLLVYYQVKMFSEVVTDSFRCFFAPPSYSFKISGGKKSIHLLKLAEDKLKVFHAFNELQEKYSGKELDTSYIYGVHRIYKTDRRVSKDVFDVDEEVFFLFYNDYLVFSGSIDSIKDYIKDMGKNRDIDFPDFDNWDFESVFSSRNIKKWYPPFFSADNPITNQEGDVLATSSIENNRHTIRILINNK